MLIASAGLVVATPASAATGTSIITLKPTDSTFSNAAKPTAKYNSKTYLSFTKKQSRTFLKFDGAALKGRKVLSASLELKVVYSTATKKGVAVFPSSAKWSSRTLTAKNQPEASTTALNTPAVVARAGKTIDVPLAKVSTVSSGVFSFRLAYAQAYVSGTFAKHGASAPKLRVTVETPPGAPAPQSPDHPVFAHYFPPYPISIDNKEAGEDYYTRNYLSPTGESGKHAAYGGLLRDRPEGRPPIRVANWELADMMTEIRQAKAAGIDGFTLNLMSATGRNWDAGIDLIEAADAVGGFTIVPNLDASAGIVDLPVATVADRLAALYKHRSVYRVDGVPVLSSFKAEGKSVAWWRDLIATLKARHAVSVKFIAVFLNASDANLKAYAPISYGFGNWGTRTASSISKSPDYAAKAHALGKIWMAPVAVQDARPRNFLYAEAGNTETLRASWLKAVSTDADAVQIATWNDYSESTSVAPSAAHGTTFLDISERYIAWFHSGRQPAITRDAVFVTHRIQKASAGNLLGLKTLSPTLGGMSTPPRDTVEVLAYLTAPTKVTVDVGGKRTEFTAPAGVWASTVPLSNGAVSATLDRGGRKVATVTSDRPVVTAPLASDLQYFGASSLDR